MCPHSRLTLTEPNRVNGVHWDNVFVCGSNQPIRLFYIPYKDFSDYISLAAVFSGES
jgi:hypothetical protein